MHTALGGVVHRVVHQPGPHRIGTDVDDASVTARNHVREYRSHAVDRRPQVVVDGGPQRLFGVFEGWPDHPATGVVDQNIDVAERTDRRRDEVVGRAGLVEFADEPAGDRRLLVDVVQVFFAAGRRENRCAIGDEACSDTQADTRCRAGDDRRAAAECVTHRMIATSATSRRSVMSSSARLAAMRKLPSVRLNR